MSKRLAHYSTVIRHANPISFIVVAIAAIAVGLLGTVALPAAETAAKFIVGVIL
jgi:hypothetical protein